MFLVNSAFQFDELAFAILALFKRTRCYISGHGSFDLNLLRRSFKKSLYVNVIFRLLFIMYKGYLCNSYGEYNNLPNFIKRRAQVIENLYPKWTISYESTQTHQTEFEHKVVINKKKKTILYLGRIVDKKQVLETITALHLTGTLEAFHFLIVGPVPETKYLNSIQNYVLKNNLGSSVTVYPYHVSGQAKIDLISNADAVILMSSSEGLPIVLIEALLLGRPVICTPEANMNADEWIFCSSLSALTYNNIEEFISAKRQKFQLKDVGRYKLENFINEQSFRD